ncbi:MAG: glycoside hydrolase family 13 protein [Saccharospirillum sp.]
MTHPWWHNAVVYQIYPRSFMDSNNDGMGDLPGIISKLDYLVQLGIDVIWLSPVFKSPMDDNGYDISDYEDIAPEFGTLADMDRLIAEAGTRGIRIILDLVVNHSSDEHPWFVSARQSKDSSYREFYIWRPPQADGSPPSELHSYFGGSMWAFDEPTGEYYLHQFSKKQPDLNWENPAVHEAVHAMMNRWLDRGIAGFRMDVIDLIGKDVDRGIFAKGPRLHDLLQAMNHATFGNRNALTVGEAWSADTEEAKRYSDPSGNELSMVFQFEHIVIGWDPEHGKWKPRPFNLVELKRVFAKWQTELHGQGWNSLFWNNHDLPRAVSKYGDPGHYRIRSAKMLAIALHLMQGTPYIYQGEELGMTNVQFESIDDYQDIETRNLYAERIAAGHDAAEMMAAIHENSRDNARTPMQWYGSAYAGFSQSQPWLKVNPNYRDINAAQCLEDPDSVFYCYQKLIQLRKGHDVIVHGDFELLLPDHEKVFAYQRIDANNTLLVCTNFTADSVAVELPASVLNKDGDCLTTNMEPRNRLDAHLTLAPFEAFAILWENA